MPNDSTPTKTATLVKRTDALGKTAVYRLDPPMQTHEHVWVSAINNQFGHETFIFASDPDGRVKSWAELPGSLRFSTDHAEALAGAGYSIAEATR